MCLEEFDLYRQHNCGAIWLNEATCSPRVNYLYLKWIVSTFKRPSHLGYNLPRFARSPSWKTCHLIFLLKTLDVHICLIELDVSLGLEPLFIKCFSSWSHDISLSPSVISVATVTNMMLFGPPWEAYLWPINEQVVATPWCLDQYCISPMEQVELLVPISPWRRDGFLYNLDDCLVKGFFCTIWSGVVCS